MASKQSQIKRALARKKRESQKPHTKATPLYFEDIKKRRETNTAIACMTLNLPPISLKAQRDLAHFQWTQARYFMERTESKRLSLEPYNGSWIQIMGVVSEARYVKGNLRLCIASPEYILDGENGGFEGAQIDSHLWIKMTNFILNDEDDGRVDYRPSNDSVIGEGMISLGDFISFNGLVEPYIKKGEVKFGVSKIKNLSNGSLIWKDGRKGTYQKLNHYSRKSYLVKATQLPGTNKFSYQYATYEMIKAHTDYFENYQSDYALLEKRKKKMKFIKKIKRHPETVLLILSHGGVLSYFTLAKLQLNNGYQKLVTFNQHHATLLSQSTHILRVYPWLLLLLLVTLVVLFQAIHRIARWGILGVNFIVLVHLLGLF